MNLSHDHTLRLIRRLCLALVAFAMCGLATFGAGAASAHDQLLSSTPAEGEQLPKAPAAAELTFSGQISSIGAEFALSGAGGEQLVLPAAPEVDGTVASQPLPRLAAGHYALAWRIVSEDGHPVSGTITFSVDPGETPETSAAPSAPAAVDEQPTPSGQPTQAGLASPEDSGGGLPVWVTAIIGAAAAALAVLLVSRFRRRRGE